jgi:hypothetical protein
MAGREESLGGNYEVRDFWSGELMVPNAGGINEQTGLPILRQRPPDFKPMARPESELDPDVPKHPGVTSWDFVDARGLDLTTPWCRRRVSRRSRSIGGRWRSTARRRLTLRSTTSNSYGHDGTNWTRGARLSCETPAPLEI